jgi:hypothetical protein
MNSFTGSTQTTARSGASYLTPSCLTGRKGRPWSKSPSGRTVSPPSWCYSENIVLIIASDGAPFLAIGDAAPHAAASVVLPDAPAPSTGRLRDRHLPRALRA